MQRLMGAGQRLDSGPRLAGAVLAVGGGLAWAMVIVTLPALARAGSAADARGGWPAWLEGGIGRLLLLDAHDLRLAALVVIVAGIAVLVASGPRLAARPGPTLSVAVIALVLANLAWGLSGVEGPVALVGVLLSTGAGTAAATVVAARRWPSGEPGADQVPDAPTAVEPAAVESAAVESAEPEPPARAVVGVGSDGNARPVLGSAGRTWLVAVALLAAGTVAALSLQTAVTPELDGVVPGAYSGVLLAVRVLLVLAAVAAACAAGGFGPGPRVPSGAVVGIGFAVLTVAGAGPGLFAGWWALLSSGLLLAVVLGLVWWGTAAGAPVGVRSVLGLGVAVLLPVPQLVVAQVGVVLGSSTLVLAAADFGADGYPAFGVGMLLAALLLLADRFGRPRPVLLDPQPVDPQPVDPQPVDPQPVDADPVQVPPVDDAADVRADLDPVDAHTADRTR